MTLQDQGFRFVCRDGKFDWTHPAEALPSDVDCTDMDDATFEAFVIATGAIREETVYEKSARWNWPDGRPDL